MKFHGNSKQNNKEHHLYGVYDSEENDVFKYGISDKKIEEDGYSSRMREQVDYLNRAVGWLRFFQKFLFKLLVEKKKHEKSKMTMSMIIEKNMGGTPEEMC